MKPRFQNYREIIQWSEEEKAYVAHAPALPGCVAHGSTMQQAAREIHVSMELWLESAHKHGDPIPEPDLPDEEINRHV